MKLIVGLGNPESRYDNTRHNVGFMVLDRFAEQQGLAFKAMPKFKALVAEYSGSHKALLIKPTTYYNESGTALRAIADFYKVDLGDIVVIHDDLALPLGSVRTRIGGSSAGNNGIKSVTSHLGEATARIRIGIWSEHRDHIADVDFVLGAFSDEERKILDELAPIATSLIDAFIDDKFETTTHTTSV